MNSCRNSLRLAGVLAVLVALSSNAYYSPNWKRILADNTFFDLPGPAFAVSFISSDDYVLSATCWYRYVVGTDPVVLHGKRVSDDVFRPVVNYEVATEGKMKWKRISASVQQPDSDTITVNPNAPVTRLLVDMEPFRKAIGTFRYGRLVLENKDAAIFAIEDLLPPADARGDTNDFKEIVFETPEGKKSQGFLDDWIVAPAELLNVISFGDRLIGEFVFEAASAKTVALEGTKTLDGDFWPKARFQAANSDHAWKTIGESQNNGTPATLQIPNGKSERIRVLLTDYRPLIGKFKYGKIIFSNGQSAIFSIDLLNPH